MERIVLLMCCFGVGISEDNTTVTEGPLREILHGPVPGAAPTSVKEAIVVIPGSDASHFRKLSGEDSENAKICVLNDLKSFCPLFSGGL